MKTCIITVNDLTYSGSQTMNHHVPLLGNVPNGIELVALPKEKFLNIVMSLPKIKSADTAKDFASLLLRESQSDIDFTVGYYKEALEKEMELIQFYVDCNELLDEFKKEKLSQV
jgi:hypothetical protein